MIVKTLWRHGQEAGRKVFTSGFENPNARTSSDHRVEQSREDWKAGMVGRSVAGGHFTEVREGKRLGKGFCGMQFCDKLRKCTLTF